LRVIIKNYNNKIYNIALYGLGNNQFYLIDDEKIKVEKDSVFQNNYNHIPSIKIASIISTPVSAKPLLDYSLEMTIEEYNNKLKSLEKYIESGDYGIHWICKTKENEYDFLQNNYEIIYDTKIEYIDPEILMYNYTEKDMLQEIGFILKKYGYDGDINI